MAEHNLIQAPEVVRRLFTVFGLRQPHITPALGEVVTPVAILADVSRSGAPDARTSFFRGGYSGTGDNVSRVAAVILTNPANSGIIVKIRHLGFSFSVGPAHDNLIAWDVKDAALLDTGGGSGLNPTGDTMPQNQGVNVRGEAAPTLRSRIRIASGTLSTSTVTGFRSWVRSVPQDAFGQLHYTEDFGDPHRPTLYPGGGFHLAHFTDVAADMYWNFFWTEEPVT